MTGLKRLATNGTGQRGPGRVRPRRFPRMAPLSLLKGATPTRAPTCRRSRVPTPAANRVSLSHAGDGAQEVAPPWDSDGESAADPCPGRQLSLHGNGNGGGGAQAVLLRSCAFGRWVSASRRGRTAGRTASEVIQRVVLASFPVALATRIFLGRQSCHQRTSSNPPEDSSNTMIQGPSAGNAGPLPRHGEPPICRP